MGICQVVVTQSKRSRAFIALRKVVGPESCPDMALVTAALRRHGCVEEADIVMKNQQLLDRLRNTLVSSLVELAYPDDPKCGNCRQEECAGCHLSTLLKELT